MASIKQAEQKVELRSRKVKEAGEKLANAMTEFTGSTHQLILAQGELADARAGEKGGQAKGNGGTGGKGAGGGKQKTPAQEKATAGAPRSGPREEESELD